MQTHFLNTENEIFLVYIRDDFYNVNITGHVEMIHSREKTGS